MGQIREGVGYFWKCVGWFLVVIIPGGGSGKLYVTCSEKLSCSRGQDKEGWLSHVFWWTWETSELEAVLSERIIPLS
jgi:hypothetical protein